MRALDEFNNGQLFSATELAAAELRSDPSSPAARFLFAQLQCFHGEFEKADRHFEFFQKQTEAPLPGVALCRQLVRSALARQECFLNGRVPEFFSEPPPNVQSSLKALTALRNGEVAAAAELLAASDCPLATAGTINGVQFQTLTDLDDLTASVLEVFTPTGKYFWIPFSKIRSMELHPPKRPLDLLWRPARLDVVDGPDGEVFVPMIYPTLSTDILSETEKLGRSTDWVSLGDQHFRGKGLRIWQADETEYTSLEIQSVQFQAGNSEAEIIEPGADNG